MTRATDIYGRTVDLDAHYRQLTAHERPVAAPPAPLPAQLDTSGGLHEIAPQIEAMRLFEPAPRQLDGQTYMRTDWLPEQVAATESERAAHEVQQRRVQAWRDGSVRVGSGRP